MAFDKLLIQPGIDRQKTQTLNEGGWSFANLIRFRNGLIEKQGGWLRLDDEQLIGTVRGLHAFQDLAIVDYLAAGSEQRLQLYSGGNIYDITPIRATTNVGSAFTTTMGSSTVTITDVSNGVTTGDWIQLVCPIAIASLVLLGFYRVTSVIDNDNYTIDAGSDADSSITLGGHTPFFTTTNTSNIVQVTLPNNGYVVNDLFYVQVPLVISGLTLTDVYLVDTIIDADNFTILASAGASGSDTDYENNDEARINYLLQSGYASDTVISGWGGGFWGEGTWGLGSESTTALIPLRNWYLDNFGENLVALPTNGTLYQWVPPLANGNVATAVTGAPLYGTAMFVLMPQAQVAILGAEASGVQDPLLVRWCDNGDYTNWTASITNQAGSYRLSKGSKIIGGIQAPQLALIWTDTDLWAMQYIQQPFIYGFNILASGCGMIASKACTVLANTIYWVSPRGFFEYSQSGGVQPLLCSVWDVIFADLDKNNQTKTFLGSNSLFNEMMCFYPSQSNGSGEIDSYVKYNSAEGFWDYGRLIRTAWIDSNVFGNPIGVDENRRLQQHEVGQDNDDIPMETSAESGFIDIASGELFLFINWMIPDFIFRGDNPSVTLTIYGRDFPNGASTTYGPFTVTNTSVSNYINIRARHRQLAVKIESDTAGTFWRLGAVRFRGAPAGRI